jgi:hypothetical protein
MDTEGSDVSAGFTRNAKDAKTTVIVKLDEVNLVNRSDAELTLDGADERRPLKERTRQCLESAC